MDLKFTVQLKIRKPIAEVFDAVVNPEKMSGYFIEKSTGPLAGGKTVRWKFPEFPDEFDVVCVEAATNERLVIEWEAAEGGYNTRTEFVFKPLGEAKTQVLVTESGWKDNPKNLEAAFGNCGGWMNFLCCLKAYLEYGVNLREGSFD